VTFAVIFCARCRSSKVDVIGWEGSVATFRCSACDHEARVEGFTLGRVFADEVGIPRAAAVLKAAQEDRVFPPGQGPVIVPARPPAPPAPPVVQPQRPYVFVKGGRA
jgi:hypothetical protein